MYFLYIYICIQYQIEIDDTWPTFLAFAFVNLERDSTLNFFEATCLLRDLGFTQKPYFNGLLCRCVQSKCKKRLPRKKYEETL